MDNAQFLATQLRKLADAVATQCETSSGIFAYDGFPLVKCAVTCTDGDVVTIVAGFEPPQDETE